MNRVFVTALNNVKKFTSSVTNIQNANEDTPCILLAYGDPGYGKTRTAIWYTAKENGAIYCRCINNMSQRWLLEKIVAEAGEIPSYRTPNLFNQIVDQFLTNPRILIIDEVDYLCANGAVEILRDIHDITHVPMVLVGMGMLDKKLMRFKHLYDRIIEIVKFMPLTRQDIHVAINQMCEVKLLDDAVDYITAQTTGKFRGLIKYIHRAEYIARANNLKEVTAKNLKE